MVVKKLGQPVPASRMTWKLSAGRRFFHSSLESFIGSLGEGTVAPAGRKVFQFFCSSSTPFIFAVGAALAWRAKAASARAFSRVRRSMGLLSGMRSRLGRPAGTFLTVYSGKLKRIETPAGAG